MRFCCLVIVLVLSGALALDSWGQASESPPQAKTEQKTNDTPATNPDAKTQNSKIEIAPIAAPAPSPNQSENKPATEATQNSNEASEGTEYWVYRGYKVKITDGLLVLFTLGLVVIGALQAIFLRGTLTATAVAAKAAEAAAKHIPTVERAWAFCHPGIGTSISDPDFTLAIKNHGKTPAFIKVVCVGGAKDEPLAPNPTYDGLKRHQINIILSEGESRPFAAATLTSKTGKYYYGFIRYTDIFDKRQISRFCVFMDRHNGLSMAGHPDYNTHCTEE
jgi:hypothetical protein